MAGTRGRKSRVTPEQWRVARIAWESDRTVTDESLGKTLGVSKQLVQKKRYEEGWARHENPDQVTAKAYAAADLLPRLRKTAPPPDDTPVPDADDSAQDVEFVEKPAKTAPLVNKVVSDEFVAPEKPLLGHQYLGDHESATTRMDLSPYELQQLAELDAVNQRAAILALHREEMDRPRAMLAEAMAKNDLEQIKAAKLAAEAVAVIQNAERKSWGLDREGGRGLTIVIDRG